jgi:hypothetical protein
MLKTALTKKEKPIMTSEKYKRFISLIESEQLETLDGLSSRNKERIGEWLDTVEIKEDFDGEPYVVSPFVGLPLYTRKDISYATLYKWCASKFEKAKLTRLPVPVDMSIYYCNRWKKNPTINPYTNEEVSISLDPNGKYVGVYKRVLDGLSIDIMKKKTRKVLTVEECRLIKDALPNDHARVFIDRGRDSIYQIYYDYLFIVYFVKSKTIPYDPAFTDDLNIYLDVAVYDTSQFVYNEGETYIDFHYTAEFLYIRKFFKNYLLNMGESDHLSIHILQTKLCIEIDDLIQFMREPPHINAKITTAAIDRINYNINVLSYCKSLFVKIPFQYVEEYIGNPQNKNNYVFVKEFLLSVLKAREQAIEEKYKDIYGELIYYIEEEEAASSNIFDTFIRFYNTLIKLYRDNTKATIHKNYIKDPYNTNKGVEPQIPRRAQLPIDLQRYKMTTVASGAPKNPETERLLKDYEDKWEAQLKEYERKKDIYDRIYEGKVSPPPKKPLRHNKPHKSASPPKVSLIKYGKIGKIGEAGEALSASPLKKYRSGSGGVSGRGKDGKGSGDYYVNDSDPYTQEPFADMHPNKSKNATDIIYKSGRKEYHYRFDTVNMYNYILKCIEICEKPINFFNRVELTDADINEVCNKIKHFTKKPTYNYADDIRPLLDDDCSKYNNRLVLFWDEIKEEKDKEREIIGVIDIYLYIDLGGIYLKVSPQKVLTLPIFNSKIAKTIPNHTLMLKVIEEKLLAGELISSRFFPYRKSKPILNLPEFAFDLKDTAEKTLERLQRYKQKLEQM